MQQVEGLAGSWTLEELLQRQRLNGCGSDLSSKEVEIGSRGWVGRGLQGACKPWQRLVKWI